jgi:hypothetical protein
MRAQMGAIKARRASVQNATKRQQYNDILDHWHNGERNPRLETRGEMRLKFPNLAYEYCVIHYYPTEFYDALIQAGLINV